MKILVSHGANHNLGDIAMLESVAGHLLDLLPDSELHIVDRAGLQTEVWGWSRVRRARQPKTRDYSYSRYFDQIPLLRQLRTPAQTVWSICRHAVCGRPAPRGPTHAAPGSLTDWASQFDALHIAGGGNLNDLFPSTLWEHCSLLQAFAALARPAVLTGQQLGPFWHSVTKDCLRRALRRVAFLGLRESGESYEMCRRGLLDPAQFAVMGDDSLGLQPASAEEARHLLGESGLMPGRFVAINVRLAKYSDVSTAHLQSVAEFVRALAEQLDRPVLVVPIALNRGEESGVAGYRAAIDSDVLSGQELRKLLPEIVHVLDVPDLQAKQAKAILAAAYGAVGVSYHFCTFALSEGVPAICLHRGSYYGQKASGLAAFWGDPRLTLSLEGLHPAAAAKQVLHVFDDQSLRAALAKRAARAKAEWLRIFRERVNEAFGHGGRIGSISARHKHGCRPSQR